MKPKIRVIIALSDPFKGAAILLALLANGIDCIRPSDIVGPEKEPYPSVILLDGTDIESEAPKAVMSAVGRQLFVCDAGMVNPDWLSGFVNDLKGMSPELETFGLVQGAQRMDPETFPNVYDLDQADWIEFTTGRIQSFLASIGQRQPAEATT